MPRGTVHTQESLSPRRMSDLNDEGVVPGRPQLGVPPTISAWTAEARAQTERGRRSSCVECIDEVSALNRNQGPNHEVQEQEHGEVPRL